MLIEHTENQVIYPGAGDVDDCWVVSAHTAAKAVRPDIPKGSVTWMRGAANDPDDGYKDGGNSTEILRLVRRMWPEIRVFKIDGKDWAYLAGKCQRAIRPVSLAILSSKLPLSYRYGFNGAHQVTVWWENGNWYIANPLAKEGATPRRIAAKYLRAAAEALTGNKTVRGVMFPTFAEAQRTRLRYTQPQMEAAITEAQKLITASAGEDLAKAQEQLQNLVNAVNAAYAVAHEPDEIDS